MPYQISEYHITSLKQHQTSDGTAFVCTVKRAGKNVGQAEQSGRGGSTFFHFHTRELQRHFLETARQFAQRTDQAGTPEPDEVFLLALIEGYENDRLSKTRSVIESSKKDDLGIAEVYSFKGQITREMYPALRSRDPELCYRWVSGQGWELIPKYFALHLGSTDHRQLAATLSQAAQTLSEKGSLPRRMGTVSVAFSQGFRPPDDFLGQGVHLNLKARDDQAACEMLADIAQLTKIQALTPHLERWHRQWHRAGRLTGEATLYRS